MEHKVVKRYSLSRQVADQLEHMIESGEYAVGSRIPTESALMAMFSVSRNTLREAIQSLTSAGVLIVRQGDGTYVRSNNRFNANMDREYARVSIQDIKETRNAMEQTIASLAAQRRTEEDMAAITAAFQKRSRLQVTAKENSRADMEFHMAIAQASHNQILYDLYRSISSYLESQIAELQAADNVDMAVLDRYHEELYYAILDKKSDSAVSSVQNILSF